MKSKELIISEINKDGKINVSQFIQLSQFGNDGYYIKNPPIGSKNDFITAPEISQMFGEILASFFINYWQEKINTDFNLVELGPGKGTLIKDILRVASKNENFFNATYLTLIEKNEYLISLQKNNLNFDRVNWSKEFDIQKKNEPLIIFSNEFFDCFPVRQFYKKTKWYEKFIQYNNSEKIFSFISKEVNNKEILQVLKKFNHVRVAEISESRIKYFDLMCKFIKKNKGVFFTIDYGYKNPTNNLTLQTIYNHKKTHLFENIGNQDITAYVNFGELINIANKNNLNIDLFCTQKDFLISYGIKERKNRLQINKNKELIEKLDLEYERLVSKSQMGEIFKVLVISCS